MKKGIKNIIYFISVALFMLLISLPLLNDMFCIIPVEETFGKWENRNPAPEAYFNIEELEPFPQDFDNYYNDNFTFRQFCLKSYIYIKYMILGQSPYPSKVIIGKKGWLYEGSAEREMYEGKMKMSPDTLKMIADELHCRAVKLKEKNIKFYIAFPPTKYMIYPEYLPDYIVSRPDFSLELIDLLKKDSLINFIDLKDALEKSKNAGQLYHNCDNHWNQLGGLFAVSSIVREMTKDMPELVAPDISSYRIDTATNNIGNLSYMTGMKYYFNNFNVEPKPLFNTRSHPGAKFNFPITPWFPYPDQYEIVSQIDNTKLPKLLIIRDSFADATMPFFNEYFSRVTYIFDSWQYKLNEEIVNTEKPDAVLLLVFVPHIKNIAKNCDCK